MDTVSTIILPSLLFAAFFTGMETAFVSANRIHIELEKKNGGAVGRILTRLTDDPSRFLVGMLLGHCIALVGYGMAIGPLLLDWFQGLLPLPSPFLEALFTDFVLLPQVLVAVLIFLPLAAYLPRLFFHIYANTLLKALCLPAYLFHLLFSPLSWAVLKLSDGFMRALFKTKGSSLQLSFSKLELEDYITEHMETVEGEEEVDSEIQLFQNALQFSTLKAREVMVPRTEITAVELGESPKALTKLFIETGYSKILVYKDSIDEIIGYVHSYELFNRPKTIKSMLLPVELVPETMLIQDILNVLTKKRKSMAVVLDEYGGTAGIMTVEDIVEELFGEIEDEHDTVDLFEEKVSENEYRFSARLEVDYVNEIYRLELPVGEEYETLGGLIVNHTGDIPDQGSEVAIEGFTFKILEVSNTKIDLVSLRVHAED